MTIEEYSTLMGYEKTCEMAEYETANFIYMMAGDMDKQTFCKKNGNFRSVRDALRKRECRAGGG